MIGSGGGDMKSVWLPGFSVQGNHASYLASLVTDDFTCTELNPGPPRASADARDIGAAAEGRYRPWGAYDQEIFIG